MRVRVGVTVRVRVRVRVGVRARFGIVQDKGDEREGQRQGQDNGMRDRARNERPSKASPLPHNSTSVLPLSSAGM